MVRLQCQEVEDRTRDDVIAALEKHLPGGWRVAEAGEAGTVNAEATLTAADASVAQRAAQDVVLEALSDAGFAPGRATIEEVEVRASS